jgi:hypothetical protein
MSLSPFLKEKHLKKINTTKTFETENSYYYQNMNSDRYSLENSKESVKL